MRGIVVFAVVGLWFGFGRSASADDVAEARTYYEAGREAFAGAKYAISIAAFEEALRRAPRASVRFSLAKAYRFQFFVDNDGARAARALALFRAYVAEITDGELRQESVRYIAELAPVVAAWEADRSARNQPPPPPPKPKTELMVSSRTPGAKVRIDRGAAYGTPALAEVAPGNHAIHVEADGFFPEDVAGTAVEGRLVVLEIALRERPSWIAIDAPRGAQISIDGKPIGTAPQPPIAVTAGKHFVVVTRRGHHPSTHNVTLERGETQKLAAPLRRTTQRKLAYVLGAAGVAIAGAGVVATSYALAARADADAIADRRAAGNLTPAELAEQHRRVEAYERDTTLSQLLYGGAAATLATGALLYLVDMPQVASSGEAPAPILTPRAEPGGFSLTFTAAF